MGKTWLVENSLENDKELLVLPFQVPSVRQAHERDPSLIIRLLEASPEKKIVFIDEAQKVPSIFDSVQYVIDKKMAMVILTGSSARKLRQKGANLLPGRAKNYRLDPLTWCEMGITGESRIPELEMKKIPGRHAFSFKESLVYGCLPGIAMQKPEDRAGFLRSYAESYLEEEIRAEALSRNIGAFSRFLELAASESGSAPNMSKLSMESGVSVPAIKGYYSVLEDTLVIERVDPYLKNARKRILSTPRYYFFDTGVRNALARLPLVPELLHAQRGSLFEHAVMLEIIRRARSKDFWCRVNYWRTGGGAEVDCVLDCGDRVVPIEIKATAHVSRSDASGIAAFLSEYPKVASHGYVITDGEVPEKLSDTVTAVPWHMM
ncbi:MAG: ATP-binding protein [Chitinispirillaceae bacterium]|nr:ATP-binding protein [Chitinispirillaceae bacterium]